MKHEANIPGLSAWIRERCDHRGSPSDLSELLDWREGTSQYCSTSGVVRRRRGSVGECTVVIVCKVTTVLEIVDTSRE